MDTLVTEHVSLGKRTVRNDESIYRASNDSNEIARTNFYAGQEWSLYTRTNLHNARRCR